MHGVTSSRILSPRLVSTSVPRYTLYQYRRTSPTTNLRDVRSGLAAMENGPAHPRSRPLPSRRTSDDWLSVQQTGLTAVPRTSSLAPPRARPCLVPPGASRGVRQRERHHPRGAGREWGTQTRSTGLDPQSGSWVTTTEESTKRKGERKYDSGRVVNTPTGGRQRSLFWELFVLIYGVNSPTLDQPGWLATPGPTLSTGPNSI